MRCLKVDTSDKILAASLKCMLMVRRQKGELKMLNDKEKFIVDYLRNPLAFVARKDVKTPAINELSNDELLELINKMDEYIEEEGQQKRVLGLYDEMYVLELISVKNSLKSEYGKWI